MNIPSWCKLDHFGIKEKRTSVSQEVLAGIMGWQTVVSSSSFYASLFVGDDQGVDQEATAEMFMVMGGLSTMVFAVSFNMPYIVAPSVLYTTRESGISIGGHLAAQAVANFAAAVFFFTALKPSLLLSTPNALRLGAGCGISMLVSVLGMRGVGLLSEDSFSLQPFTWQSVIGLAIVTAVCCRSSGDSTTRKSAFIIGAPLVLTTLVYAVFDRSKFQGYSDIDRPLLSNWGGGSFGAVDFSRLRDEWKRYYLYVIRTTISIVINVCSVLLVLVDAVDVEFRSMACSIPLMSSFGNLAGVTSQAAFVESMTVAFVGGKTGLSAAVTGGLLVLSTVLRPLLPVLVPEHVSGALSAVITLRFFSVIWMIDVSRPSNLLMFGVSILLIPFSFDFVDSLCIATVLGFVCEVGDTILLRQSRHVKIAVFDQRGTAEEEEEAKLAEQAEQGAQTPPAKSSTQRKRRQSSATPASPGEHGESPVVADGAEILQARTTRASFGKALISLHYSNTSGGRRTSRTSGGSFTYHRATSENTSTVGPNSVHWGMALAATLQLALSAISDKLQSDE